MGGIADAITGGGGEDAGEAMTDAARKSEELQRYMYETSREDIRPWRETGQNALSQLARLHGIYSPTVQQMAEQEATETTTAKAAEPMDFQSFADELDAYNLALLTQTGMEGGGRLPTISDWMRRRLKAAEPADTQETVVEQEIPDYSNLSYEDRMSDFFKSPDYQFRLSEGISALDRSAAARGRLFSGAQGRALTEYGQGLASTEYGNYYNRLAQLAGVGQQATQFGAQLGQQAAAGMSGAIMEAGQGRASGYLAKQQAGQNTINTAMMAAAMFSDKNLKTDISDLDLKACYEAVLNMPLKTWRYLAETGLDQDMHLGPMAQDAPEMIKVPGKEMLNIHDELMMIAGAIQYMEQNK